MDTSNSAPRLISPGDLLKEMWANYVHHWRLYALVVLPVAVFSAAYTFLVPAQEGVGGFNISGALLLGLLTVGLIVLELLSTLALLLAVKEPRTFAEVYRRSIPLLLPFLLVALLTAAIVLGGFVLLIIPGIALAIYFTFAPYILVEENVRGLEALRRSHAYVRGHWWAVFGRVIVLMAVSMVVSIASSLFPEVLAALVLPLILVPFSTVYLYQLYRSLKTLHGGAPLQKVNEKLMYGVPGVIGALALLLSIPVGIYLVSSVWPGV